MKATHKPSTRYRRLMTAGVAILLATGIAQARDDGYGYYRILEGEATRYGVTDEERNVSENEPLLEGDRISVASGSRLEVVLPDFSRMRLGEHTDIDFERLRASDNRADEYRIRLFEGELQATIDEQPDEFLLELDNASVYLLEAGSYRISGAVDSTRVLVRQGYAEILTEAGSAVARAGEEVTVEGFSNPQVWVDEAGRTDDLERWADANERNAQRSSRYVDDELGYAAADLDREGEWLEVGGSYAWRPLDRPDWRRPYYSGYWYDTPYGIHWVSQHRWGWLTAHYGYWDFDSHFGWVWYPGAVYSPAWVHWYWGPSYVGWIPSGYYYRHYGHYGYNYYGYVGHGWFGHHHRHAHWTFHDRHKFGRHHRQRFYYDDVDVVPRRELEGGIVTTDTRGLRREHWNQVEEADRILVRNASRTRGGITYRHPEDLPDAVSYVTRSVSKLHTGAAGETRLGPPQQLARSADSGGTNDSRVAGGLVVQRERSASSGVSAAPRTGTAETGTGRLTADRPTRSTTRIETRGRPTSERQAAPRAGRERVVLPSTPAALSRRPSDQREAPEPTADRSRVERRDGWQIERRSVPERDSTRSASSPEPSERSSSGRSVSGRSSSDRPEPTHRPRSGYERPERRPSATQAQPRSTPTRRYDRPTSRSSSRSSVGNRSSSRSSSKASSRGRSGSGRSSSSGGSSRSSSSSSDSGSSDGGSAGRSRSGGSGR